MLRPAITVFDAGHAIGAGHAALHAPIDAADPFAWLVGYALREGHRRDPELGQCVACGDTAPRCYAWQVGWFMQRASLAGARPRP
jgi:hypothetical protein